MKKFQDKKKVYREGWTLANERTKKINCRCSRCGAKGRKTSPERGDKCIKCEGQSDAKATWLRALRVDEWPSFIIDRPTSDALVLDLSHKMFWKVRGVIVAEHVPPNAALAYMGLEFRPALIGDRSRTEVIEELIDRTPADHLLVVVYPGFSIVPAVNRLLARGGKIIITASGNHAAAWCSKAPGVLTISEQELPIRQGRTWYGNVNGKGEAIT